MIKEITITSALIVGAVAAFLLYKRQHSRFAFNEETIEGELKLSQITDFLKSLDLKQGRDIPFVAKADCEEFKNMFHTSFPSKEGYISLFVGAYDEKTNSLTKHKLLHAKAIDAELQELLQNDHLIVLQ